MPSRDKDSAGPRAALQNASRNVIRKRGAADGSPDSTQKSKRASAGSAAGSHTGTDTQEVLQTAISSQSSSSLALEKNPIAKSKATEAPQAVIEKPPTWAYDVTGTWTIDASNLSHDLYWFKRLYKDSPPTFILEIQYANNPLHKKSGRQLWAKFRWGKMIGCIRLCPDQGYHMSHLQFYDDCFLGEGDWPGAAPQGITVWNLRWRGMDDTDGEVMGGSDEYETQLQFSKASDGTLQLNGKMVMGGYKARKFSGVKSSDTYSFKSDGRTVDSWWKALRDPLEESRNMYCRRCKGDIDDSSEDESDPEPEIDWDARRRARKAEEAKRKMEEEQPWPTDMTGDWKITLRQSHGLDEDDPTAQQTMQILETRSLDGTSCQYWAQFRFGRNWTGILRLCPKESFTDAQLDKLTIQQFEEACILRDGVKPGPPPDGVHSWYIKWRGDLEQKYEWEKEARKHNPSDGMTTDITFKRGEDGKLVLSGALIKGYGGGTIILFNGVRIGDGAARLPTDPTIEALWEEKAFKEPPPPAHYEWKSPLPLDLIEAPPVWAWDVLGKWKIDASFRNFQLLKDLKVPKSALCMMTIHMSNSKSQRPLSTGRQLWADFNFGGLVKGCMRFCPLPESSRPLDTVAEFEKICELKKQVWPGDKHSAPGQSFQKWGLRWRAKHLTTNFNSDYNFTCSDQEETAIDFKRDEDGSLILVGCIQVGFQVQVWKAVKIDDGEKPNSKEASVNAVWKRYSPS